MYKPIQLTNAIPSVITSLSRSPLRRGLPRKQQLPRTQAVWIIRGFLVIPLALALFALSPTARAVTPAPDGGYPNGNTAEGNNALFNLTTGIGNTALGNQALFTNTTGSNNTANGNQALFTNTTGGDNTANGVQALFNNTTGNDNTANGFEALGANTTGSDNTANGFQALGSTTGNFNTANGFQVLAFNTTGSSNTASGFQALFNNTTGNFNTANGVGALNRNTTASFNTANGLNALFSNTTGSDNTADGLSALLGNTTGNFNIALGRSAGTNLTTGSNNIEIGNLGVAGESNKIRIGTKGTQKNTFIAGINGVTVAGGVGVIIDSSGHLGTVVSSARFKDAIKPMDNASEAILALKPVTFRYKPELDPDGIPQFGLVAEQVEKVNPDLVARDDQGKAYTVRYEAVNAMLLNEFLKEHRKVEEEEVTITKVKATAGKQEATISELKSTVAQQQKRIKDLTAVIQKVNERVGLREPASRTVASTQ